MEIELATDKGLSIATVGSGAIKSFGQVIGLHVQVSSANLGQPSLKS
jgi:hypothetical protein